MASHGAPQALLAGYVWGTGSSAFLVGRVFRDNDYRRVDEALHSVAEKVWCGNTVDAYTAMSRDQPHYLKHLGGSFFTKFLYAADARDRRPGRALVLDQFVAVALKAGDDRDIWDPFTYARWIDHAHGIAAAKGARADAVEMAYFNPGRKIASSADRPRRRALAQVTVPDALPAGEPELGEQIATLGNRPVRVHSRSD